MYCKIAPARARKKPGMPVPDTIRVRLSSEEAGGIAITPVVVRDMAARELVEQVLCVTGKQAELVREMLRRGSLVAGASRLRWQPFEASREEIDDLLEGFPNADRGRRFSARQCVSVLLRGPAFRVALTREAASRRRFLKRGNFWDVLMRLADADEPAYLEYSYRDRADAYRMTLGREAEAALRAAALLLPYASLSRQIAEFDIEAVDLMVTR